MILKANLDESGFEIVVDEKVIQSSAVLKNLTKLSKGNEPVDIPMTAAHLQKIVQFLNHFPTPTSPKDLLFEKSFFDEMTTEELMAFSQAVDYLDVDRFTQAVAEYIVNEKLVNMDTKQMAEYFNVVDDFTPEERHQMANFPLEYFTGTKIDR